MHHLFRCTRWLALARSTASAVKRKSAECLNEHEIQVQSLRLTTSSVMSQFQNWMGILTLSEFRLPLIFSGLASPLKI